MRSALPKVLHRIAGRSDARPCACVRCRGGHRRCRRGRRPGPRRCRRGSAAQISPAAPIFVQTERRGTAHAVLAAREALAGGYDEILVLYADTPLVQAATRSRVSRTRLPRARASWCSASKPPTRPATAGCCTRAGALLAIREHKDASQAERALTLCNAGLMAFGGRKRCRSWRRSATTTRKANSTSRTPSRSPVATADAASVLIAAEAEVMGVNDRVQLAAAEAADAGAPAGRGDARRARP